MPGPVARDREGGFLETRRSEAYGRVSREAEPLARDHDELVEAAIPILVMDDGDRIGAAGHSLEPQGRRLARRPRQLQGPGI